VAAFVELPDGKVLSGTETGELLMWDGGLIKVAIPPASTPPGALRCLRVSHAAIPLVLEGCPTVEASSLL
jgi:hypothetical protein